MTLQAVCQWIWVFFIYAFIGWCVEVIFYAVTEGKFINRGFLNGPICPVYGFGIFIVVLCLEPVRDSLILLFLGSIVLTSVLEFITGFVLEKFFDDKWWDYSKEPLNIHGYICIRFSLAWGLGCVFVVNVVYPLTMKLIDLIPQALGIVLLCFFFALVLIDMIVTLTETLKLKKTLIIVGSAVKGIRKVSDGIGEVLANGTLNAIGRFEDGKEAVELKKAQAIMGLSAVQTRILNAYPRLREGRYKDSISRLRMRFKNELVKTGMMPVMIDSPQSIYQNLPIVLYRSTFETVIDVLEARDNYTAGHSRRVSALTHNFCKVLLIPPLEAEMLELAASVHDLGKVGIPDATLNKCDKLTENEWAEMRRHPDIGADIIIKCGKLEQVAEIVRCHHEHWDGSGYPNGLFGNEIPKGAQIISICDAVDSMMIARVYREAVTTEECIAEIRISKSTSFCPELTDKFLDNWDFIVSDLYSNQSEICAKQVSAESNVIL